MINILVPQYDALLKLICLLEGYRIVWLIQVVGNLSRALHDDTVAICSSPSEAGLVDIVFIFILTVIVAHIFLWVNLHLHLFLLVSTISCGVMDLLLLSMYERRCLAVVCSRCVKRSLMIAIAKSTEHLGARVLRPRPISCDSISAFCIIRVRGIVLAFSGVLKIKISLHLLQ